MPNNLSGQFDLFAATEGVALPSSTDVASFTDGNTNDAAANFTATIDWGDGITTTGTVVGANGSFTVEGGHTYADEGFPTGVATVTRISDNAQLVLQGGVGVADADNLNVNGQPTITGNPNQALTNVVVATFTDTYANLPGDFTTPIDWGDGTTTMGTVTGSGGSYSITGSHTYTTDGSFTITTFVNDDAPDAASDGAQTQAVIGLGGTVVLNAATETVAVPAGTTVATFGDSNLSDTASNFTASIDWGDGTTTLGSVSGSNGTFTVGSTVDHTYADEGNFTEVVTITRTTDNTTTAPSGTVMVAEDDNLAAAGTTVTGSPGVALNNVTVATFTDSNTQNVAGDFVATINWGDGTSSTGTVSGSGGAFTVADSHTYAQNGQDAIIVTVSEEPDNPQATAFTDAQSTALIGLAPVSGSSITVAEGTAVAAGTQVATFSDSNLGDTAASFTASIDWGDGTSSTGTVTGSNGSFTVTSGGHSYTGGFDDEGQNTVTTTLTRADNTTATAVGAVNITESDSLTVTANNISANAGQALTNVQVATFTDTFTGNTASGFTASIDWGDGTTTLGTISGSGASFTVDGSHTYTTGGNDTLTVTVADNDPGTATATGTASASINLGGQMVFTSATEGTAVPSTTPIATFSDNNLTDTAGSFTATVDWGDGVTTAGSVVGAAGSFTVEGGHIYTDEGGNIPVAVTLTRTADQSTSTVSGPVAVAEGDSFTGQGTTITANLDQTFNGTVATFTDTDTATSASDLAATVAWGDGVTTTGTVSGSNGSFTVSGSHAYTATGQDTVTVSLLDDTPGTATGTATTTANVTALSGQMVLNAATEATALPNSTAVATFSDSNGSDTAGSFTATIDWGDGVTTAGSVVGSAGSFTVEGGHTYADEGSDPASVTLTRTSDQLQTTATGTVSVAEGDVLTGHGTSIAIQTNQPFSGTVATFTDTDSANVASDFAATINWGDGTTTAGTISGSNGAFVVSGTHTYTSPGSDTVQVTLADDAPGTATATATSTATVRTLTGAMLLHAATEGRALANSTSVATFVDSDTADTASQFTATINWGDGVTTAGTVVGSNGLFTVEGGHTYADEGSDSASVTLTHNPDESQGTATGSVAVAEGDVLTGQGLHIKPKAGAVFSGAVATFSDTDTANVAGDFTATINWGDGTTTTGTVVGSNGSFTVDGSHTYAHPGDEAVVVTLADDAPGTARAIADTNATVSQDPHHDKASVVSDDSSDSTILGGTGNGSLIWPNSDGMLSSWLTNATKPVVATALSNLGWQLGSADGFTANGQAGLLFQGGGGPIASPPGPLPGSELKPLGGGPQLAGTSSSLLAGAPDSPGKHQLFSPT
jgi:hypothetical protein